MHYIGPNAVLQQNLRNGCYAVNGTYRILQPDNSNIPMTKTHLHKHLLQGLLWVTLLAASSCAGQYNSIEQQDPHENDKYVYGEIGGPPLQSANQYEPNPEADARAVAIREKLFGPTGQLEQGN